MSNSRVDIAAGAARRRRERRLRSWLKHERMTVAMALAEASHHTAPRGQRTARAGVWGREMNYTATIRDPPTPQPELFSLYDEEPGGSRPDRMPALSGPQEQVLRHTVDQIVVAVSALPTFDVPVPQTVDQLVGALLHLDTPIPEHAIFEVPKISCPSRFPRSALREPQKAEQLVEAPTLVSLVEVIEQPVDIPVRAWYGTGGRLQGFLPGQSSSSSVEQIADIPVPRRGIYGGSQGFHPGQSSTAVAEQIVDTPVPHGSRHLQDPGFATLPSEVAGEAFQGVFSTFPRRKKSAKMGSHSGSELLPESSPSTPGAHVDHWVDGDDVWIRIDSVDGPFWKRLLSDHVQWHPPWERH